MRRFLFAALLLWPALAHAQRCMQDTQNFTCGGINACPAPVLSVSAVVMEDSGGNQVCAAQVPCGNVEVDNASIRCSGDFVTLGTVPSTNVVCGANEQGWFNGSSELTCGGANTLATTTAPGNPASGFLSCWPDSTGLDYTCKTSSGVTTHGVQTQPGLSGEYLTSITQQGGVNFAQVQFSQLGGTGTCNQTAGTTTLYDSGSCGGQAWPTGSTPFGAGQFLRTETGGLKQLVASTIAGDGTTIASPNTGIPPENLTLSAIGLMDGAGTPVPWSTAGAFANGGVLYTAGGHISETPVSQLGAKYAYYIAAVPTTSFQWIATSSSNLIGASAIEYPNDFKAGNVFAKINFFASVPNTGPTTLTCVVTRNGTGIAGTGITVTLGTYGVTTTSVAATGSSSFNDTYGVQCEASTGGATVDFTYLMVLLP